MGVLPLQFQEGQNLETLGLTGEELFHIEGLGEELAPMSELTVRAEKQDGTKLKFQVNARLNTGVELEYYRNGGILHKVLRDFLSE
jgi:aconitate hydratase